MIGGVLLLVVLETLWTPERVLHRQKQMGRPKGRPFDALAVLGGICRLYGNRGFPLGSSHGLGSKTSSRVRHSCPYHVFNTLICKHLFVAGNVE